MTLRRSSVMAASLGSSRYDRNAQRAGAVRRDVKPREVKALLVGVIAAATSMDLDAEARARLTTVATDGLRSRHQR
jgi:hypothetical protein